MACTGCGKLEDAGQGACGTCGAPLDPPSAPRGRHRGLKRVAGLTLAAVGGLVGLRGWAMVRGPREAGSGVLEVAQAQARMAQVQSQAIEADLGKDARVPTAPPASGGTPAPAVAEEVPARIRVQASSRIPPGAAPGLRGDPVELQLKVRVDAQGQPVEVTVIQGAAGPYGRAFEREAERAARASTYLPATRNGQPCEGWITLGYRFR